MITKVSRVENLCHGRLDDKLISNSRWKKFGLLQDAKCEIELHNRLLDYLKIDESHFAHLSYNCED